MEKYKCLECDYIYDPEQNEDIALDELDEDWTCPKCNADISNFYLFES